MPAIRKDLNCANCKFKSSSIRTFNAHLRTNHLEETGSKPKSNFDKNSNGRICFKNLTIRLDGMKCHSCPFIATNDQLVSDHIRDEHQEEATSTPKKTPRRYPSVLETVFKPGETQQIKFLGITFCSLNEIIHVNFNTYKNAR